MELVYKPKITLFYNDIDKTAQIPFINITINDYAKGQADTCNITLSYNTPEPRLNDTIKVFCDGVLLGAFYINKIKIKYKQTYELECVSANLSRAKQIKNRTFKESEFLKVAESIAKENGLKFKAQVSKNELKNYQQNNQSDLAFLSNECDKLGVNMSIKNDTLILHDANKENKRLKYELQESELIELDYEFIAAVSAGSVEVTYFDAKENKDIVVRAGSSEPVKRINSFVKNKQEALTLANSKLQTQKNASFKGSLKVLGRAMNAGALLDIVLENKTLNTQIEKITHSINASGFITSVEFC